MRSWIQRRTKERRTVVVHTSDGDTLHGVLTDHGRDGLILSAAQFVQSQVDQHNLEGDIYVPHDKVKFIQVLRP